MDTTTALTIIAPEEFQDKINQVRSKYDRAYPRWMPHINLLFPFVSLDNFEDIVDRLKELNDFGEIDLNMNEINYFSQGKNVTVHIKPSNKNRLSELFEKITILLPEIKPKHNEFHPHLTLAQFKKSELNEKLKELQEWLGDGFVFKINKISLIKRNDNSPFVVEKEVMLNKS